MLIGFIIVISYDQANSAAKGSTVRGIKKQQIKQSVCNPSKKSGSMAEFLKKAEANQKQQEPLEKPSTPSQKKQQLQQEERCQVKRSGPMAEFLKKAEVKQKQQQEAVDTPCLQSQKKQQLKKFCVPGSLSTYRDLRRKQVRNVNVDVVTENHSENEVENEGLRTCVNASEAGHDREPELEQQVDIAEPEQHEKESEPTSEPPNEGINC